ncbi:MAG: AraC family transcriptional regulator [Victivallaceae bacterium]|nr:AraC family transcriptional regulator [Victivallaceae bacterium]
MISIYNIKIMIFSYLNLQVKVNDAVQGVLDKRWHDNSYQDQYARFYYITDGSGAIELAGTKIELLPNQLYLIPPHTTFNYGTEIGIEKLWVHFAATVFWELSLFDLFPCSSYCYSDVNGDIGVKIKNVVNHYQSGELRHYLQSQSCMIELISLFVGAQNAPMTVKYDKIQRLMPVIKYMNRHCRECLPIEDLARRAGYQKNYFIALFRQLFSITPHHYLQRRRIEYARGMLSDGNEKLESIAISLGYGSAFHFSKVFKQHTGISPSEFRQRQKYNLP